MILSVNIEDYSIKKIDLNPELQNVYQDPSDFQEFCQNLCINAHPEDREALMRFVEPERVQERLSKSVYITLESRIKHTDRSYFWSEIIICNSEREDEAGGRTALFLIHDIHERKTLELKKEAETRMQIMDLHDRYDALFLENMTDQQTGCFNRKGMKYYTDIVLKEAREKGKHLFVCVADLNGLKYLNDTYGHAAGDEAIAAVSSELLKAAPENSKVIRTGGDEFLMMAAIDRDSNEPEIMGDKIDKGLNLYNTSHNNPYEIGVSYGWVIMPPKEDMTSLDEYVALADEKMYQMKTQRDKHRR
jgi:diguanylate cyclase (GGDEF)-like protein